MSSYVFWSNKGGVGKSTLTFQVACKYARNNPTKKVLLIDLSPQCDSSRMMLGGGCWNGEEKIIDLMKLTPIRKTIQGYLNDCLNDVPTGNGWPQLNNYIVMPNSQRDTQAKALPTNLELLCGDFDLERTVQLIDLMPQPPVRGGRTPSGPQYSTKALVRSFIRQLVNQYHVIHGSDCCVFIDTDPYYNVVTTHLGVAGADNLICTYSPGSQASQYAVERSLEFLHDTTSGFGFEMAREYLLYPMPWFDNRGNSLIAPIINAPVCHTIICNMATPYKSKGSLPYSNPQQLHQSVISAMQSRINAQCSSYYLNSPNYEYMWDLKRLGLICDYHGVDLDTLHTGQMYPQSGSTKPYQLATTGGTPIQLSAYKNRINGLVSNIT